MKTDRELLELAARASGTSIHFAPDGTPHLAEMEGNASLRYWQPWNPLTDDGDALRLATRLDIQIFPSDRPGFATCDVHRSYVYATEPHGTDRYAAVRRSIVRAAAQLADRNPDN